MYHPVSVVYDLGAVMGYNLGDGGTETGAEEINKRGTIPGISGNL
jgi:hypothetical protein